MTRAPRRRGRVLVGVLCLTVAVPTAWPLVADTAVAAEEPPTSAVTVNGRGAYADLAVTVSQTQELVNQVVRVTWTGARPTVPAFAEFGVHYLQLMQCWGDPPSEPGGAWAEPTREQCQYGASERGTVVGYAADSRQVRYQATDLPDPAETYDLATTEFVPFRAVSGAVVATPRDNSFFDAASTNEQAAARTRADGGGEAYFEVQTGSQAPGLGCGAVLSGTPAGDLGPRPCWLVVVPRGDAEVNGSQRSGISSDRVNSSPLAVSNWANRIAIRLDFVPLALPCPIGAEERPVTGHEFVAGAISRWQQVLCRETGTPYSFSRLSDDQARSQITSERPDLAVLQEPLPPGTTDDTDPVVYAPLAISGFTIAFNIERQSPTPGPTDGERMRTMRLNARLVAKLLTQSYRAAVPVGSVDYLATNPFDLTRDPEFLEENPEFDRTFFPNPITNPLVSIQDADAVTKLFEWLRADPEAAAFLDGQPDRWGAKVNPSYQGDALVLPTTYFPKQDPTCRPWPGPEALPERCTIDIAPYAPDMSAAGRAASRGETLAQDLADVAALPPVWRRQPAQQSGQQTMLTVVDVDTAARYGLATAQLRNADGDYVAPTTDSLLAAVEAMDDGEVAGVLDSDPATKAEGAYPLTVVSYAATRPRGLTVEERGSYATFLRYASGPGQTPGFRAGQLPEGYAPLTEELREQTLAAADAIEDYVEPPEEPSPAPVPPFGPVLDDPGVSTPPASGSGFTPASRPGAAAPAAPQAAAPPPASGLDSLSAADVSAAAQRTPAEPLGWVRWVLLASLLLGALFAFAGPGLLGVAAARRR